MQGLANFAAQIGYILTLLLPPICYLGALVLFVIAGWGFWRQVHPDNPYRGRPWLPLLWLLMSGVLASFDRILTKANVTAGSSVSVSAVAITSYVPPPSAGSVIGSTPAATLVNVVSIFELFFQAFGAMACLMAILAWRSSVTGTSRRPQSASLVQFVFGIMLINVLTVSQWVVSIFA